MNMDIDRKKRHIERTRCEVRFDNLTRQLYATDASIYQVEPLGVAFPRTAEEAGAVIAAAAEAGTSVTPRGAGTGLAGGAVGDGLVIDFARYTRQITDLNLERQTVRVGAGVVLDQLNAFLKPHGLCFGPDVATSSRATLGGMISSNSSGARAPLYGTTVEHVASLEVVLADGRVQTVGPDRVDLPDVRKAVDAVVDKNRDVIAKRFPPILSKHWPGYGLDRYMRAQGDLTKIIGGSEGTLAGVLSAELRLAPIPARKGIGLVFFDSVTDATQATVELLDLHPVAIEHIDRPLLDQTRDQLAFRDTRRLLRLDEEPCEAILIVEFYDDIGERLETLQKRRLGIRFAAATDPAEIEMIWALRKAGLSLLTGRKGPAKPVAGLEDVSLPPECLPDYVAALRSLIEPLGIEASFYGHAASGLLHVRPMLDLHKEEDIGKFRQLADEVFALAAQFKGSIAAEHGVGIARTEYLADYLGQELMDAMRAVKNAFDPRGVMNPGKIIADGREYRIDANLRWGAGYELALPFEPVLAFAHKDESFVGNLEQCNGCGGCRKDAPSMCPTYIATGEEIMSTRGRANTIRAVLDQRIKGFKDPLLSEELDVALSNCVSCKACAAECPSNVNMALLKAELIYARQRRYGISLRERAVGSVDLLSALGCMAPRLANAATTWRWVRILMERFLGIAANRPLPRYASERFDRWFSGRPHNGQATRGRVILWDDTFARYNDPHVAKAAVAVIEAAGYQVALAEKRKCCGRPAFSAGRLDRAKKLGEHNVKLFLEDGTNDPVVFLEPSCYSMFAEDYRELRIPGAEEVGKRCFLFEDFIQDLLTREPEAIAFAQGHRSVAIHTHCHAKALTDISIHKRLAEHLPNTTVTMLETGCCGMAGQFGMLKSKQDLSIKIAQPLVDQINALQTGTDVVASGTSCRHQIDDLTDVRPLHMAEWLAKALPVDRP